MPLLPCRSYPQAEFDAWVPLLSLARYFANRIRRRPGRHSLSRRRSRPRRALARALRGEWPALRGEDRPGVPREPGERLRHRPLGPARRFGAAVVAGGHRLGQPARRRRRPRARRRISGVIDDTKDDVPLDEFAAAIRICSSASTRSPPIAPARSATSCFCWFPFLPIGAGVSLPPKPPGTPPPSFPARSGAGLAEAAREGC